MLSTFVFVFLIIKIIRFCYVFILWLHTAKCHTMYFYSHSYYTVIVIAYLHGGVCHISLDLITPASGFCDVKKNWNHLV